MKPSAAHAEGFFASSHGTPDAAAMLDPRRQPRRDPVNLDRPPAQLASEAAEAVRALNHATLNVKAFQEPIDVANVVSSLATLAERLDQAINQAGSGLRRLHEQQGIRMDDGSDVDEQVADTSQDLLSAQIALSALRDHLRAASRPLTHMGGPWPDGEEEDEGV